MEIQFNAGGAISGAAIRTYLLERSRVVRLLFVFSTPMLAVCVCPEALFALCDCRCWTNHMCTAFAPLLLPPTRVLCTRMHIHAHARTHIYTGPLLPRLCKLLL